MVNFTPVRRDGYRIGVPRPGVYRELLNSDDARFGGSGVHNADLTAEEVPMHGQPQSIALTLPPLSALIFSTPAAEKAAPREKKAPASEKAAPAGAAKKPVSEKHTAKAAPAAKRTAAKKPAASVQKDGQ